MERSRSKSVLIPISPLKTLLNTNRDAVARLCADYGRTTGTQVEILPQVTGMRFTGERKPDNAQASSAVGYLDDLMEIIKYMVQTSERIESPEIRNLMTTDFETFVRCVLSILNWFETGEDYELPDDVLKLILEVKASRLKAKPRPEVDADKLISDALLKDDPAFTYLRSSRNLPYRIHKFILEKKIKATDAAVAICREFSGQWKDLENQMEQMRSKSITDDASWNDIFSKKDKLIERWKTSLSAL